MKKKYYKFINEEEEKEFEKFRKKMKNRLKSMTLKELFDSLVSAGIYTKKGNLTKNYQYEGEEISTLPKKIDLKRLNKKEEKMNVYETKFLKKNGEERKMIFAEIESIPQELKNFKNERKNNKKEDQKVVWDLESNGFRIINTKELLQEAKVIETLTFEEAKNKYTK
jgi:hypothetical protein